jgi:hypothetical protein
MTCLQDYLDNELLFQAHVPWRKKCLKTPKEISLYYMEGTNTPCRKEEGFYAYSLIMGRAGYGIILLPLLKG